MKYTFSPPKFDYTDKGFVVGGFGTKLSGASPQRGD